MRKQCNKCYHFSKGKCNKTNTRVNPTKHRPNCKYWITKEQYWAKEDRRNDYIQRNNMSYNDIINMISHMGGLK